VSGSVASHVADGQACRRLGALDVAHHDKESSSYRLDSLDKTLRGATTPVVILRPP